MGFYDRSLIQAVANAPQTYGTLDVVPMGGASMLTVIVTDTVLHEFLPPPPAGYTYRLHLFSSAWTGVAAYLTGGSSAALYCVLNTSGNFLFGGLLCYEGLVVQDGTAVPGNRLTLFYDTILTPYVS